MAARARTGHVDSQWLDFVADLLSTPLTSWPHEQVSRLLVDTFSAPASGHYFNTGSRLEQRTWPPEFFRPFASEVESWTRNGAVREHPLLRYYVATGDSRAMQVTDVPSRFADGQVMARWRELGRAWGDVTSQIAIPVCFGPMAQRAFLVGRPDVYSRQEMELAIRLQRLLVALDRQITAYADWSIRCGSAGAELAEAVHLTPRELAVLDLLARGMTASSIGRRLSIAERTVQKHLQHCYGKLGVADRLAAVQRATTIGLLPPGGIGGWGAATYFPSYPEQAAMGSNPRSRVSTALDEPH